MTEQSESPIAVAVTATVQETENHTTNTNQGIINNGIIIIQRGDSAPPPSHHKTPPSHHPKVAAAHRPSSPPQASTQSATPKPSLPGAIAPVVSFGLDGDKVTTYQSQDGARAIFREDKQNGGAVTLTLQDSNGILTTHGDRRGFEFNKIDALGHLKTETVTLDTYWKSPLDIGSVLDKVNCPDTKLKGTNVLPTITGDVTRDKLQQFAAAHSALTDTLSHVQLPATVSGGKQMTFGSAVAAPSEFRACPPHEAKGIIRKGH